MKKNILIFYKYFIKFLSSFFGIGFLPGGGTIISIIFYLFLNKFYFQINNLYILIFYILSIIIVKLETINTNKHDPSYIVLDEAFAFTIGYEYLNKLNLLNYNLLFLILFRFFDITKILGIKKFENIRGTMGIIIDDIIAIFYSIIIIKIISLF
jgi:phosphatidylglycerophosphatase A